MTDLEWLIMAARRATELPDTRLDWKWVRFGKYKVVFTHHSQHPYIGDRDGLEPFTLAAYYASDRSERIQVWPPA